jgi:uncharacterized protein YjbI with pentapeptide repeats
MVIRFANRVKCSIYTRAQRALRTLASLRFASLRFASLRFASLRFASLSEANARYLHAHKQHCRFLSVKNIYETGIPFSSFAFFYSGEWKIRFAFF